MNVTVVGCSGSFPGPASPASCYLVQAEDGDRTWNVALDMGAGAVGALQRHLDPRDLDAVFLTHLHPDHCSDLCGLYVLRRHHPERRASHPLPVYGPTDTRRRVSEAYGLSDSHGMDAEFDYRDHRDGQPVAVGPLTITPYAVRHPVEAYGLRVETDSAVLAYTGDTDECDALTPLMAGASLVLADSAFVAGRDTTRGVHMNGAQCAQAANRAGGVRRLMLTHMPAWNDQETCRAQAAEHWSGEVELAAPDATYRL